MAAARGVVAASSTASVLTDLLASQQQTLAQLVSQGALVQRTLAELVSQGALVQRTFAELVGQQRTLVSQGALAQRTLATLTYTLSEGASVRPRGDVHPHYFYATTADMQVLCGSPKRTTCRSFSAHLSRPSKTATSLRCPRIYRGRT